MKFYITLISALMLLVACQIKTPDDIIQPDEMESLLYDYHIVQAMGKEVGDAEDYQVKLYFEYVFKKHGVTKELFDSSMVWYARHPSYMMQMYANLQEQFDYEVATLQEDKLLAQVTNSVERDYSVDTLQLWEGRVVERLTSAPLNNKQIMSFTSDTAFVAGDSVAFSFDTRFFSSNKEKLQGIYAALLLTYTDNTTESHALNISESGNNVIAVPRDFNRTIKDIDAFIYYTDNDKSARSGVILNAVSLVRIHPAIETTEQP